MQVILKNENEKNNSKRVNVIDVDIYIRRSSRCLERKCNSRFGSRSVRIQDNRRIFRKNKLEEENKESKKIAELKKLKQKQQIMEEFIQMFRKAARGSSYKE